MKKVFVNPKASIKHIINKAKEWNGRTYRGFFLIGDQGQEVSLELTYRNDGVNPPYMSGKVKWGTLIDKFAPIEDNAEALDWITNFVVDFYKRVTRNTDFSHGIPVTIIDF